MGNYFIEVPPPTPNGPLHLGHIAGPYLAADTYNRKLRLDKNKTFFACDLDRNQSYVRVASEQNGREYTEFLKEKSDSIENTFVNYEIGFDRFIKDSTSLRDSTIKKFIYKLLQSSHVCEKEVEFYYDNSANIFLVEGYISGSCPKCNANVKGGVCEICGFYNGSIDIVNPVATLNSSLKLSKKKCKIYIIKLSQFNDKLKAILANAEINDFAKDFIYKNLLENIHDFPITLPLEDGFSINGSNNKLNPWVEILGSTYFLKEMAQNKFSDTGQNNTLVHTCFMGIDNAFYYAIVFNIIRYILNLQDYPKNYYINRYYLLEGKKFSTSRGHVIWADDVLKQFCLESLRVFLAFTYPLNENYDFNNQKLEEFDKFDIAQSCNTLLANPDANLPKSICSFDKNILFYEYASMLLTIIKNGKNNALDLIYLLQILLPKTSEKMFRCFGKIEQIAEVSTCSSKIEFGIKLNRLIYLTENNFCASIAEVALNQQTIPHKHDDLEEIFFITSGEGILSIDNNTYYVKPNDYIYIPGGKLHTIKQSGINPLIFITIAWKNNKSKHCAK